jgi:Zn-dependent protease with chaperone function
VGHNRFRGAISLLLLFLLTASNSAFGGRKAPKLAETIDLPSSFDIDFQLAANQRVQFGPRKEAPDDIASRVGADVFQSLVTTQMIAGFGLPYAWALKVDDIPEVNAYSLADGQVVAYKGLSRLIGTNRGLWAAVLAHEVAHVARRHQIKRYLFHEYVEQQVRYWQMRARLGDKGAGWTALAVRIAGNLAEKKLSRDMEHDADMQGMLLMARAGYHPDYAFAMHHLLRMNTPERSKVGTFFFSDHPRWETRDQRTERAYTEAVVEYNQLWASPDTSPGGTPPAVAFLGSTRGTENKEGGTGDLTLALSCRNVERPVALVIHLTKGDRAPVQSMVADYRDSAGNVVIHERASCLDTDSAKPTVVHIPTAVIPAQDRKLKAQVEVLGPNDETLERSRVFDVHFPKRDQRNTTIIAKVRVEPELGKMPWANKADQYKLADAVAPVPIHTETPSASTPLPTTPVEQPNLVIAAAPVAISPGHANEGVYRATVEIHAALPNRVSPSDPPTRETLGVLPSALDGSGVPSNWAHSLAPNGPLTWWQASEPSGLPLKISLSRLVVFFPVQPVDTESLPASVIITNHTSTALLLSGLTITGDNSSDFTQTNDCGGVIDAGATCTMSLTFKPTANGTRISRLTVDVAAEKITLTGIGK